MKTAKRKKKEIIYIDLTKTQCLSSHIHIYFLFYFIYTSNLLQYF